MKIQYFQRCFVVNYYLLFQNTPYCDLLKTNSWPFSLWIVYSYIVICQYPSTICQSVHVAVLSTCTIIISRQQILQIVSIDFSSKRQLLSRLLRKFPTLSIVGYFFRARQNYHGDSTISIKKSWNTVRSKIHSISASRSPQVKRSFSMAR